jgi:CheY-like chemotaxis protein
VGTLRTAPILVVEDDEETRAVLRASLEDVGLSVVEAGTGREALDQLTAPEAQVPSVIVCDLEMPTLSGWDLLAIMRNYAGLAQIPVIIVSGYEVSQARLNETGHGAIVAVLRKPLDGDVFVSLVKQHAGVSS